MHTFDSTYGCDGTIPTDWLYREASLLIALRFSDIYQRYCTHAGMQVYTSADLVCSGDFEEFSI